MIKTFFYLKTDKQNNERESPIYAKIELQVKKTTLSTGKFISTERWVFTNKLRNKLRLNTEMNSKTAIDLLKIKIESIYFELSKNNLNTTLFDVKNTLNGKSTITGDVDILKLFKKHNDNFKKMFEAGEPTAFWNFAKEIVQRAITRFASSRGSSLYILLGLSPIYNVI